MIELLDVCRHLDQPRYFRMGFAATANLFARREVLKRLGGFDGALSSNGDRELCLRATAHGFKLAYSPQAVVVHPPRTRARQAMEKSFRLGIGLAQTRGGPAGTWNGSNPEPAGPPRGWRKLAGKRAALLAGPEVFGIECIRSQGYEPSRAELVLIQLAGYGLMDLPRVAGYLAARIRT